MAGGAGLRAQTGASVRDGIYTEAQAKRGDEGYHKECASCHGAEMEGKGQAPALKGMEFTANWTGQTVGDLFEKIQGSMPADRPGQLSGETNAAILAYILQRNGFPGGKQELAGDAEALRKIRFEAATR
jgi:mono/diheme cytochrome c family protein